MSDVIKAVLAFDGQHVGDLRLVVGTLTKDDEAQLVELCSNGDRLHRIAATWLVKAILEKGLGGSLDLWKVFSRLAVEEEPDAILHLLQSVQYAPEPASDHKDALHRFLKDRKTLVCVWALDALVRVCIEKNEDLDIARELVNEALGNERASMRARARQLAPLVGL